MHFATRSIACLVAVFALVLAPPASAQVTNDDCATPTAILLLGTTLYSNVGATSSAFAGGEFQCFPLNIGILFGPFKVCKTTVTGDVFFTGVAPATGTYTIETCGSSFDTVLQVFFGGDCSACCLGHNDNAVCSGVPSTQSRVTVFLDLGDTILIQIGGCGPADTGTGSISTTFTPANVEMVAACTPVANSTGQPTTLSGSRWIPNSNGDPSLLLMASSGPPDEFGFYIVSFSTAPAAMVFGGNLCLGSPIGRLDVNTATTTGLPQLNSVGQFNANGLFASLAGNAYPGIFPGAPPSEQYGFLNPVLLPPVLGPTSIAPGETLYYQMWHRDQIAGIPTANFSDTICVTFP